MISSLTMAIELDASKSYNELLNAAILSDFDTNPRLSWLSPALISTWSGQTRALFRHADGDLAEESIHFTPQSLIDKAASSPSRSVCVIENIGPSWIDVLGKAWNIETHFFLAHACKPADKGTWDAVFHGSENHKLFPCTDHDRYNHISGVFEYFGWKSKPQYQIDSRPNFMQRICWEGPAPYPVSSHTTISYCRVSSGFYLILVDAPLDLASQCDPIEQHYLPSLRFKCSKSRGGLLVPPIYADTSFKFSLFECFQSFLSHGWHYNILFREGYESLTIPWTNLVYLLASSLFETNSRALRSKVEQISFYDLRDPDIHTTNALHDCRRDLVFLKAAVVEASTYLPYEVESWFSRHGQSQSGYSRGMISTLERIKNDIESISAFLMESFSLLISTISTLDAQRSAEQGKRSTLLTQLAFIYVPLSFVTGVYGMNIQQINSSGMQIWVPIVTLAISILATLLIFYGLKLRSEYLDMKVKEPKRPKAFVLVLKSERDRVMKIFKRWTPSSDVEKFGR